MAAAPDESFLERQRRRLTTEAGALLASLTDMGEEEFDQRAAGLLERWSALQVERTGMVEKVFTPEQVAEHLSITPAKVREWLRSGYLKGFKLGLKEWRIAEQDLEAFINRLRAGTPDGE